MKKRILLIIAAIVLLAMVVCWPQSGFFNAPTDSSSNKLTASTVTLHSTRAGGDLLRGPMFYVGDGDGLIATGVWAPGDTVERVMRVENTGSLTALLKRVTASIEQDTAHLADKLLVTVKDDYNRTVVSGDLNDFLGNGKSFDRPILLDPSNVATFTFAVTLKLDAADTLQGTTAKVSFHVNAEQAANNH